MIFQYFLIRKKLNQPATKAIVMRRKGYHAGLQILMPDTLNNFEFLTVSECLKAFETTCHSSGRTSVFLTLYLDLPVVIEQPERVSLYFLVRYAQGRGFLVEKVKVVCLVTLDHIDFPCSTLRQIPSLNKVRALFARKSFGKAKCGKRVV